MRGISRTIGWRVGVLALAAVVPAMSAGAATGTYAITVDAYMDSGSPTKNYGAASTDKVVFNDTNNTATRSLLAMPADVAGTPEADVVSAKVWLYTFNDQTQGRVIRLHPLARAFVEGTGNGAVTGDGATWLTSDGATAWTTPGGDYNAAVYVNDTRGANWFCFDITAVWDDVRSFGALLKMADEATYAGGTMPRAPFTSSDGTTVSQRPYLELTVTPEPVTLALLAAGAGLVVRRRRRGRAA